jgi:hypothetical protein
MKKNFILLMVVIMLAGLAFGSFAEWTGNGRTDVGDPIRDCLKDGTGDYCPNPDGCVPTGDENKHKGNR